MARIKIKKSIFDRMVRYFTLTRQRDRMLNPKETDDEIIMLRKSLAPIMTYDNLTTAARTKSNIDYLNETITSLKASLAMEEESYKKLMKEIELE